MKTNQNTLFGIIAALIAVIFTLAAFAACPQPADETPAPDQTITIDPSLSDGEGAITSYIKSKTKFQNIEVKNAMGTNCIQNGKMILYFDLDSYQVAIDRFGWDIIFQGWGEEIDFANLPIVALILRKLNQRQA